MLYRGEAKLDKTLIDVLINDLTNTIMVKTSNKHH